MKLVCSQNDLSSNLSLVSRAVPSKPTHPVLANLLLTADLETQRVSLTAFVDSSGELTIPAKLLNDIVSRLPESEITIDDVDGEYIATLEAASGRYRVRGMGSEEYPALPTVENGKTISLAAETLIEGLQGSLFATSGDETKQVLTGVHLTSKEDGLEFAATDGHRLAMVETANQASLESSDREEETEVETEFQVTIPARALRELERMIGSKGANLSIAIHFDRSQMVFELNDQRLTTRLLEGQYPAYRQLIPPSFSRTATIDRKQLLSALERISVLADPKNSVVRAILDEEKQTMALSTESQDVGSGREVIPIQYSGEDLEIGFNIKYLSDSLKNLSTTEIEMDLNAALSPVVIKPLSGAKATHVIMPVQIRE
jgi:DNA polymerase III subunit beta